MGKFATSSSISTVQNVAFIGIDYHKRFSMLCLGDRNGHYLGFHKLYNDPKSVAEFFSQYPEASCAIESCRGFEWLVDLVRELGVSIVVSDPLRTKLIVESKRKTDKVDSKAIMQLLAKDFLPTCYIASAEERRLRELLRWRSNLVSLAVSVKNAITCVIDKENLGLNHKDIFSLAGRKFLKDAPVTHTHRVLLDKQLAVLADLEAKLKVEDLWARAEAKHNARSARLQQIPGFGPLTSLIYVAEIGDVSRFRRAAQVSSYAGLVTSVYDSADTHRTGRITKKGSRFLRSSLIQAAWASLKHPYFRQKFSTIAFRSGRNKAITAIARKLCEIAYRLLRDGADFDERKLLA